MLTRALMGASAVVVVALASATTAGADPYYPPPSVLCGLKADGVTFDEMVNMYTPEGYSADQRGREIMAVVQQYCP